MGLILRPLAYDEAMRIQAERLQAASQTRSELAGVAAYRSKRRFLMRFRLRRVLYRWAPRLGELV